MARESKQKLADARTNSVGAAATAIETALGVWSIKKLGKMTEAFKGTDRELAEVSSGRPERELPKQSSEPPEVPMKPVAAKSEIAKPRTSPVDVPSSRDPFDLRVNESVYEAKDVALISKRFREEWKKLNGALRDSNPNAFRAYDNLNISEKLKDVDRVERALRASSPGGELSPTHVKSLATYRGQLQAAETRRLRLASLSVKGPTILSEQAKAMDLPEELIRRARANGLGDGSVGYLSSPRGLAEIDEIVDSIRASGRSDLEGGVIIFDRDVMMGGPEKKLQEAWHSKHGGKPPIVIGAHGNQKEMALNSAGDPSVMKAMLQNNPYGGLQIAAVLKRLGVETQGRDIIMYSCQGGASCGLSQVLPNRIYTPPPTSLVEKHDHTFVPVDEAIDDVWKKAMENFSGDVNRAKGLDDFDNVLYFQDGVLK